MTILLVIACGVMLPHVVANLDNDLLGLAASDGKWWMAVQGAAFQFGMLGGVLAGALIHRWSYRPEPALESPAPAQPTRQPILAGVITFLITLPLISVIGFAWSALLEAFGIVPAEQELVKLFRDADDPVLLGVMIILAVVVAPLTEELIFRAGIFRYLRTRIYRWLAMTIGALLFASMHDGITTFLPLFAFGIFFSIAYERTGRIAVPIIAHALFNLHTIILVMAGITP
jgi:membrane protease YdiL (CAAX protease family)